MQERKRLDELERHRQMGLSAAWSEFAELEDGEEDASPPLKRHCAGRMLNWEGLQRVSLTERMGDRRREVLRTAARRKREAQARQEAQERRTRQMEAQEAERERKRAERERRKSEKEEDTRRRQEEKARAKKKREKEKARAKEEREKEKGRGSEDRWSAAEES